MKQLDLKRNRAFLLSVGLHSALTAFVLAFLLPRPHFREPPIGAIQLTLIDRPRSEPRVTTLLREHQINVHPPHSPVKSNPVALSALGINYHFAQTETEATSKSDETLGVYQKDARVDLVKESKNLKLLRYVFQQIDGKLAYPHELAEHRLTATVVAELSFSKDGEYLESESRITTPSGFFKVVTTRALRQAFRDHIPADKITVHSPFRINCQMRFELTEHHDVEFAKTKNMILGEQLSFYRFYQKSKLEWDLGPLHGLGPLASLDVLWIPKKIGQLFSQKAEIDPLDQYRDDPAWQ